MATGAGSSNITNFLVSAEVEAQKTKIEKNIVSFAVKKCFKAIYP